MSWTPRFFDNLTVAINYVKSFLPIEIRGSVENDDIARHLKLSQVKVEDFLVSSGFDLSALPEEVEPNAMILHIYHCLRSMLEILPLPLDRKPELLARWVEVIKETEERILARKFPPKSLRAVFKPIKITSKIGEKEE